MQSTSYALDLDFSTYAWCQAASINDRAIYRFDFTTERRLHSMTIYRHNGIVSFFFLIVKKLLLLGSSCQSGLLKQPSPRRAAYYAAAALTCFQNSY